MYTSLVVEVIILESKINFGETFKNIRNNKKLNQEEVCFGIISRTALSKFENGKNSITIGHFIFFVK